VFGEPALERRQYVVGVFPTRKAAEAAGRAAISTLEAGGDPFAEDVSTADYLGRWLEHMAGRVRPRTLLRYRQLLERHVSPVIGHVPLCKVRPAHVQAAMDAMTAAGAAPRSVVHARAVLGGAMRRAVAWGLIPANPVSAVAPPQAERPDLAVPDAAGLMALLEAARGTDWEVPILLAVATGARRGEVLAARWSDLDLDTGRLRITGSLQRVDGELQRVAPKTDRARRLVTLPGFARERLRAHRKEQAELRLLLGARWEASDVICDRAGRLIDPDAFSKGFKVVAGRAGLPSAMRLHDVRHGVATGWLEQGLHPGIASAALGHSSPAFTMSQYQHVVDGMGDRAAEALEAFLGTGSRPDVVTTLSRLGDG
jgi:integrase